MYEGRCLCGACTWRYEDEPDGATACNCSACRRYGVLWIYGFDGEGVSASGALKAFRRGDGWLDFEFCPGCGCVVAWRAAAVDENGRRRLAVNLRLVEPASEAVLAIPVDHFDGADTFEDLPRDGKCVRDYWI